MEPRFSRCGLHQPVGVWQVEINQLSAAIADSVVVAFGNAIVATGTITKTDLMNKASFLEIAKRVIDRGITNRWQSAPRCLENLAGGGVILAFLDYLEYGFPLWR
jgi:uncharacterized protein YyaL (SSP411 family)